MWCVPNNQETHIHVILYTFPVVDSKLICLMNSESIGESIVMGIGSCHNMIKTTTQEEPE